MTRLYVLPGLAADARTFGQFSVPGMEVVPFTWVPPRKGESLSQYAHKLREQVQEDEPFCLLGVSFGGMIMLELAKIIRPQHTFLVSAAKTHREIPPYYRLIGFTPRLLPYWLWKRLMVRSRKKGAAVHDEFLEVLLTMIRESEGSLFRWSTSATLRWRNYTVPENLSHMHGQQDPLLPAKYMTPDVWVEDGTHYLINTHATQISQWIRDTTTPAQS